MFRLFLLCLGLRGRRGRTCRARENPGPACVEAVGIESILYLKREERGVEGEAGKQLALQPAVEEMYYIHWLEGPLDGNTAFPRKLMLSTLMWNSAT